MASRLRCLCGAAVGCAAAGRLPALSECLPASFLTCPHLPVPSTPLPLISPLLLLPACLPAPCRSQLHDHFPVVPICYLAITSPCHSRNPAPPSVLPPGLPPCSQLHDHFPVVPDLIRSYIQQVQGDLHLITNSPGQRLLTGQAGGTRRGCTAPHWCGSRLRACVCACVIACPAASTHAWPPLTTLLRPSLGIMCRHAPG